MAEWRSGCVQAPVPKEYHSFCQTWYSLGPTGAPAPRAIQGEGHLPPWVDEWQHRSPSAPARFDKSQPCNALENAPPCCAMSTRNWPHGHMSLPTKGLGAWRFGNVPSGNACAVATDGSAVRCVIITRCDWTCYGSAPSRVDGALAWDGRGWQTAVATLDREPYPQELMGQDVRCGVAASCSGGDAGTAFAMVILGWERARVLTLGWSPVLRASPCEPVCHGGLRLAFYC